MNRSIGALIALLFSISAAIAAPPAIPPPAPPTLASLGAAPAGLVSIVTSSPATVTVAQWAACLAVVPNAGSLTVTLALSSTYSSNGCLVLSTINAVTLALANGADKITSGAGAGSAGASLSIAANQTLIVTTDAAGNFYVANNPSGGGVTSITGTANQITASASTGAITLSFPAGGVTLPGSTTTGNIGTSNITLDGAGRAICWNNSSCVGATTDGHLYIQTNAGGGGLAIDLGANDTAGAPNAGSLNANSVAAGQTNTAGADFTFNGSTGTGTGDGGSWVFRTGHKGTTGTAKNTEIEDFAVTTHGLRTKGTIPVVTGTGSPTIVAGSTDTAGEVTGGTSATSIVITFSETKGNAPFCTVDPQDQKASFTYTISTTAITITQTATTGTKVDYVCFQH